MERLFTKQSNNKKHIESITTWQNELELFSDTEKISSKVGFTKFLKAFISNFKSDTYSTPLKDLDQEKISRSISLI